MKRSFLLLIATTLLCTSVFSQTLKFEVVQAAVVYDYEPTKTDWNPCNITIWHNIDAKSITLFTERKLTFKYDELKLYKDLSNTKVYYSKGYETGSSIQVSLELLVTPNTYTTLKIKYKDGLAVIYRMEKIGIKYN